MGRFKNLCHFILICWSVDQIKSQNLEEFLTGSSHVKSYKIVYPKIKSSEGSRAKRSSVEDIPLKISLENWILETLLNEHLIIAPGFFSQEIFHSRGIQDRRNLDAEDPASCEVRHGFVVGQTESMTALTVCSNSRIYGLVKADNRTFFIQPLTDGRHLLYESSKNLSNDRDKSMNNVGNIFQRTRRSLEGVGNFEAGEDGLKQMLNYVDYLGANNLNTSSANDILLAAASRLTAGETLWTGPQSEYQRDDNFYLNFKSRIPERNNSSGTRERVKRNFMICNTREFYNLTGDMIDVESMLRAPAKENEETESDSVELPVEKDFENIGYFFDRAWERNKLPKRKLITKNSPPRWLEIGIVADYSVLEFHGSRVQQYILALFNIVSAIYKDPSLESNLKLVIVRMIFFSEKKDGMVRRGNARKSLENVNRWNRKYLSSSEDNHDIAVWLTRLDLGGPSGYAPVSGVCDPARSCALNRDEGLTSAFIIAHELAHVLGLTHDGDVAAGNSCGEEASMGSVMAPMVAATFHRFHWSTCSKKEFHERSRQWECLLNEPNDRNATHLKATVQSTFTMDEQCRMEFGEGYSLCRSFDLPEPCSHLWCGHENSSQICKTKKGPPLEGTECGDDKWCINGYCELVDRRRFGLGPVIHNARDGGWSSWSPWKKCSTSCGVGVQFRSRSCSEPTPAYGGMDCKGDSEEFKICQIVECPDRIDLRAQQCSRLPSLMGFPVSSSKYNTTWLPHEPEEQSFKCQLTCRSRQTGEIFFSGENLIDGTPCSYGSSDICVQGKCRIVGCDNVINSDRANDACGECGGQNSNCNNVTSRYQRKLRRGMTRLAVIPRLAHNAKIEVVLPHVQGAVITIRDRRRRRNDIVNFDDPEKSPIVVVEGAAFRAKIIGDTCAIWSRGPVFSEVVISLGVPDKATHLGVLVSVVLHYTIHQKDVNGTARYKWVLGGWGPCSLSCGGGLKQKTIACKDDTTGKIVPKRKCPLTLKPLQETQKCNVLSCEFKWVSGEWEECTSTCGLTGIQHRELYCVHVSLNVTKVSGDTAAIIYRDMLPPDRCGPPPQSEQGCNRIPCQGRWIYTDWSPCSQTCGRGVQSRLARCGPAEPTESLFKCGQVAPFELRPCKIVDRQNSNCSDFCRADKSEYCSLAVFQRYCQVPGFRRRCCASCRNNSFVEISQDNLFSNSSM